jgi:thiamine-phosphate pyrophosphorylase
MSAFYQLMLLTNQCTSLPEYLQFITRCVRAGVSCVQLREKYLSSDALYDFAIQLKQCLAPYAVPLIINDDLSLALAIDADGVHLGQSDGDIHEARAQLGANKIIGVSINTLAELELANTLPVNYVGVGAIFPTRSKPDVKTIWGIEGLRQACMLSHHPVVAIGGIDSTTAQRVMDAGAQGIAAIGALHRATVPEDEIQYIKQAIIQ